MNIHQIGGSVLILFRIFEMFDSQHNLSLFFQSQRFLPPELSTTTGKSAKVWTSLLKAKLQSCQQEWLHKTPIPKTTSSNSSPWKCRSANTKAAFWPICLSPTSFGFMGKDFLQAKWDNFWAWFTRLSWMVWNICSNLFVSSLRRSEAAEVFG